MKDTKKRVIIERVIPQIDGGRFPAKRVLEETVKIEADIIADGHDHLAADLLYRKGGESEWRTMPMLLLVNDLWRAEFVLNTLGLYEFTVRAWIDRFDTWRSGLLKKYEAGQNVSVEMVEGAQLLAQAAQDAAERDRMLLQEKIEILENDDLPMLNRMEAALDGELSGAMRKYPDGFSLVEYDRVLQIRVEPQNALFSTWYEMFPRSAADEPGRHGNFKDCIERLPYIAEMGFDILYLPPIHPIGKTFRKGPNNTAAAGPDDPGSPWAIGGEEGGHKAIHPELGTLEDFRDLLHQARNLGIEIALDIAFQCSPDHPYVKEHPEWFKQRPDGTIQYAENPPKKYQDIYPFDFESEAEPALKEELLSVFRYWIDQGVKVFRVDNPHTKPLRFWEWLIGKVKEEFPETIFLAEAFTRPKTMYRLAKGGFTQSYTYFTWRNLKWEIEQYLTELTRDPVQDFFWPNFWPNTPDILPEFLQMSGRPGFVLRLILAGTLSSSYGIYGPAFELGVNAPRASNTEEYLDSEKYQITQWDLNAPQTIRPMIKRINRIRKENPALQQTRNLMFHPVDREEILCFSKYTDDMSNIILVAANLDPHHTQSAWVKLPPEIIGKTAGNQHQPFQMHELIGDARYLWHSEQNYIELNPQVMPAQIFRVRRRVRSENDFDYFM